MKLHITTKIRRNDLDNLRLLAAWTGETQLDLLSRLIESEMDRTKCPPRQTEQEQAAAKGGEIMKGLLAEVPEDELAEGRGLRHISNIYDPTRQDAKVWVAYGAYETQDEAWQRIQRFLADKVIGRPKATKKYTVEQLEAENFVGVYAAANDEENLS